MSDGWKVPATPTREQVKLRDRRSLRVLRWGIIGLDCLAVVELSLNSWISGRAMGDYGREVGDPNIGTTVALMYGIPAFAALICAVFLWQRWRFRWVLQATVGLLAILITGWNCLFRFFPGLEETLLPSGQTGYLPAGPRQSYAVIVSTSLIEVRHGYAESDHRKRQTWLEQRRHKLDLKSWPSDRWHRRSHDC